MLRLTKNHVRWEMDPAFAPLLDGVLSSSARTVKESAAKIVTEHSVGVTQFFVKRYRHHAVALRPLKYLFKSSQAREEWKLAQELENRNVPIVRHVALGERWSWRGLEESILITEGFDGRQLDEVCNFDWKILVEFVRQLHERGVLQRDLHLANILVNEASNELRLVDLHGIEIKTALDRSERENNLAYLRMFAPIPVSPEIISLSRKLRKTIFAQRANRCLKRNREFGRKTFGARKWQVRFPLLNSDAEKILQEPDALLSKTDSLLKNGRSSTVGASDGFVLKRYNFRKFGNLFKDCFRHSKARKNFQKAYHLELVGIPTARAVATADQRALVLLRSYFLMEKISDATPLQKCRGDDLEIIRNVARLLARLHDEGFRHRDLKPSNLLVDTSRAVHLIDLDGLAFVRNISTRLADADIARLLRGWEKAPGFGSDQRALFLKLYGEFRCID